MKRRNLLSSLFLLPLMALLPKSLFAKKKITVSGAVLPLQANGSLYLNPPFKFDDSHPRYASVHRKNGDFLAVPEIDGRFTFPAEWAGENVCLPLYRGEGETILIKFDPLKSYQFPEKR